MSEEQEEISGRANETNKKQRERSCKQDPKYERESKVGGLGGWALQKIYGLRRQHVKQASEKKKRGSASHPPLRQGLAAANSPTQHSAAHDAMRWHSRANTRAKQGEFNGDGPKRP